MRFAHPFVFGLPLLAIAACAVGADPLAGASSAIRGGDADTTHTAVVALVSDDGLSQVTGIPRICSGTIVKTDPAKKVGWVLTAAQCAVAPSTIAIETASDLSVHPGARRYRALDGKAHPLFNWMRPHDGHDFAVVRIVGVDAQTPTIGIGIGTGTGTAADGLAIGTVVRSVGFGRATTDAPAIRRSVDKAVYGLSADFITYSQTESGFCDGDFGGPVLLGDRVVGVHSYVDVTGPNSPACSGKGHSGRVASDIDFIEGQLGELPDLDSCRACEGFSQSSGGACDELSAACGADPACVSFTGCMDMPGASRAGCADSFPLGEGPWVAMTSCACNRSCADKCAAEPSCEAVTN